MPVSEQQLTPLLTRIQRQIARDGDYRCFQEKVSVEQVVLAFAAGAGLDACELLRTWAGRPEWSAKPARTRSPMPTKTRGDEDDDDFDSPDPDDDDSDGVPCPTCDGSGRLRDGSVCPTCDGSGVIDDPDQEDEDGNDDEED